MSKGKRVLEIEDGVPPPKRNGSVAKPEDKWTSTVNLRQRAQVNRRINAAVYREKIIASKQLSRILETLKKLGELDEYLQRHSDSMDRDEVGACTARVGVLKTKLDGHFKLLNKVLPDAKEQEAGPSDAEQIAARIRQSLEMMDALDSGDQTFTTIDQKTNGLADMEVGLIE